MPNPIDEDSVEYNIYIQAVEALKSIKDLASQTTSLDQKMKLATDTARKFGTQMNLSLKDSAKSLGEIDSTFRTFGTDTEKVWKKAGQGAEEFGQKTHSAVGRAVSGINILRIALGTIVAQLLFTLTNAISGVFRELIGNLREAELAVYNLVNAEKKLSEAGVDVTPKGLQEIIDSVRELVPILSQIDAEELVSRIASNVAPSLKLTTAEMEKLAKTIALAYVQNKALGYSFDEIEKSFTESALTGKVSQGMNKYGVKLNDLIISQHAVKMGLVESEEALNSLSGEMQAHIKFQAMLDYSYQEFSKNAESMGDYLGTADAQIETANKAWSDLLTTLGQAFGPAIAIGAKIIANGLTVIIALLEAGQPLIQFWVANLVGLAEAMKGMKPWDWLSEKGVEGFFDRFVKAQKRTMESFGGLEGADDTPTGIVPEVDNESALESLQEIEDALEKIRRDAEEDAIDLEIKKGQKLEDLDLEYIRKAMDAQRDYARKVEDINRDAERDLAELKQKHREEDEKAEKDYQLKLWELRMRYLMNLEDALHARDARQVIRLQKQYAIDKEALLRKKNLEDEEREQAQANEAEDIELRRQQRLEDAQIEYQQKLADQRLAKQRELDDLNVWYEREQADLELAMQRKMETLINGWIEKQKITEANAAEVYGILSKYFGPGGMTDALYTYMMQSLIASTQGAVAAAMSAMGVLGGRDMSTDIPTVTTSDSGGSAGGGGKGSKGGRRMAQGGTLLATRPTNVLFGEAGPEMATFIPLNRAANTSGLPGGNKSGIDGSITLEVLLSPDLEARIVRNSMDGVADTILKVVNSK